jgi:hypothetical protein
MRKTSLWCERGAALAVAAMLLGLVDPLAQASESRFVGPPPIPVPKPPIIGETTTPEAPRLTIPPVALPQAPFADPASQLPLAAPRTDQTAISDPNKPPQFVIHDAPTMTLVPSLRLDNSEPGNPHDVLVAPPQGQRFNPTPGLKATMDLGDLSVDTTVSQPLKGGDNRFTPDGRSTGERPKLGVDLKMKF